MNHWEPLFAKALGLLDAARIASGQDFPWTFGGGTALMTMYQHRFSKDIDIFVADPQILGHLTPRRFPEGEIDFIGTGWLTQQPFTVANILGREVKVETPAEIIGKKVYHRADTFKARRRRLARAGFPPTRKWRYSPGTNSFPFGIWIDEPLKSSPTGWKRPPRHWERNASVTA